MDKDNLIRELETVIADHCPTIADNKTKLRSYAFTIRLYEEKHETVFQRFSNRDDLDRLNDLITALKNSKNMLAGLPDNIQTEIARSIPDVENELLAPEYLYYCESEKEGIKTISKQRFSLTDDRGEELIEDNTYTEKHVPTGRTPNGNDELFHLLTRGVTSLHAATKKLQNSSLTKRKTVGNLHSREAAIVKGCKDIWEREGHSFPKELQQHAFGPFGRFVECVFGKFGLDATQVRSAHRTLVREVENGNDHADFFVSIE